jgi:hypothetical protein
MSDEKSFHFRRTTTRCSPEERPANLPLHTNKSTKMEEEEDEEGERSRKREKICWLFMG